MFRPLHWAIIRSQIVSWFYNTSFFWQLSMVTLSTRSRWMIWAICILHCIVSSETQFETWWWSGVRDETCCLSNKYSTTLLVVFWLYYLHHLIISTTTGMSQLKNSAKIKRNKVDLCYTTFMLGMWSLARSYWVGCGWEMSCTLEVTNTVTTKLFEIMHDKFWEKAVFWHAWT
jgi:hypothetical protein